MRPYVLVSGDFVQTGGMDVANYWLARHLSDLGHEVHLVAHHASDDLTRRPNVRFHRVRKPLQSYLLGEPLLDRAGRHWGNLISRKGGRVLTNGGNCRFPGTNWVHYVHAVYDPTMEGPAAQRLRKSLTRRAYMTSERRALSNSKLIIANSERTRLDIITRLPVHPDRVRTVYYGADPDKFHPASASEKAGARAVLGLPPDPPLVLFVGSAADERKGFTSLLSAWKRLCGEPGWDAHLVVAGAAPPERESRLEADSRFHFLGFRKDIPQVLAACDLLISPTRYEAYGLAVQEALCAGLPAFVTSNAGVAERYPPALHHFLLRNPEDAVELSDRVRQWRSCIDQCRQAVTEFSRELRARTWPCACAEMIELIEAAG